MKNDPKFVRDSNPSLKLLTFQLSNVRELETIKYAFDSSINHGLLDGIPEFQLNKLNGNIDRTYTASSPVDHKQKFPQNLAEAIEGHRTA